jgi:hypothetical protein
MTIFDTETDEYLDRLGGSDASGSWDDVVRRARLTGRRRRRVRATVVGGAAAAAAVGALAGVGVIGGLEGPSIVEKAEAAVLRAGAPAAGTIEHTLVQYRDGSGRPFIEYETWMAADGSWCRRTVEGIPAEAANSVVTVADTRLTECRSADGLIELYLPSTSEILRTRQSAGTTAASGPVEVGTTGLTWRVLEDGTFLIERDGAALTPSEERALPRKVLLAIKRSVNETAGTTQAAHIDPGPAPDWLTEDVIEAFRTNAVREAGTMTYQGKEYVKLVTEDGRDAVLVDPETGETVAWIPSPAAFGTPTIVVRTRDTLADDDAGRRQLSLTALHPNATVRDVSPDEFAATLASQYPRG